MKRKLIAFDIDGTLLNDQKQALESTREALQKLRKQGHLVTVATGRSRYLANEVIRDLEFSNYVVCNGAGAFLDHEQIYKNLLNEKKLREFVELLNRRAIDTAVVSLDGISRCSSYNLEKIDVAMKSFGGVLPDYQPDYLNDHEIYQGLAFYNEQMEGEFNADFPEFRFVRWHENGVDIVPKNGSKAATLMFMAKRLGIAKEDVITFGDANNDIEMLETAGVGVAMGNANPEIKAIADVVTATNNQDGIWQALRELSLV